jgi:hypothetical protein
VSTPGRYNWIQILGAATATAEVWNCTISPGGYADEFQGIGLWTIGAYVHNNYIVLPHPLYEIGTHQTDRAIEFDCVGKTEDTCGHNELAYNQIVADNNRAIRVRAETGDLIHDNVIQNCRVNAMESGCIMIGGADVYDNATSAEVYNNTIEINDGEGILVMGSSYSTANIHDNTVTCYQGDCSHAMWFAHTNQSEPGFSDPIPGAIMTVKNTTFPANWGDRNAVMACGPPGNPAWSCEDPKNLDSATVTYCNTGKVVGNGTIYESCP